jgi:hypothetical protein
MLLKVNILYILANVAANNQPFWLLKEEGIDAVQFPEHQFVPFPQRIVTLKVKKHEAPEEDVDKKQQKTTQIGQ